MAKQPNVDEVVAAVRQLVAAIIAGQDNPPDHVHVIVEDHRPR